MTLGDSTKNSNSSIQIRTKNQTPIFSLGKYLNNSQSLASPIVYIFICHYLSSYCFIFPLHYYQYCACSTFIYAWSFTRFLWFRIKFALCALALNYFTPAMGKWFSHSDFIYFCHSRRSLTLQCVKLKINPNGKIVLSSLFNKNSSVTKDSSLFA